MLYSAICLRSRDRKADWKLCVHWQGLPVNDRYCREVGRVPDTSCDVLAGMRFGQNVIEKPQIIDD